jgi:hypothetical protein
MIVRIKDITINVCNNGTGININKLTALCGPFNLIRQPEEVIKEYKEWLVHKITSHDKKVCAELNKLLQIVKEKKCLNLVCQCKPGRCHGDVIANEIVIALSNGNKFGIGPIKKRKSGSYVFMQQEMSEESKERIKQVASFKKLAANMSIK